MNTTKKKCRFATTNPLYDLKSNDRPLFYDEKFGLDQGLEGNEIVKAMKALYIDFLFTGSGEIEYIVLKDGLHRLTINIEMESEDYKIYFNSNYMEVKIDDVNDIRYYEIQKAIWIKTNVLQLSLKLDMYMTYIDELNIPIETTDDNDKELLSVEFKRKHLDRFVVERYEDIFFNMNLNQITLDDYNYGWVPYESGDRTQLNNFHIRARINGKTLNYEQYNLLSGASFTFGSQIDQSVPLQVPYEQTSIQVYIRSFTPISINNVVNPFVQQDVVRSDSSPFSSYTTRIGSFINCSIEMPYVSGSDVRVSYNVELFLTYIQQEEGGDADLYLEYVLFDAGGTDVEDGFNLLKERIENSEIYESLFADEKLFIGADNKQISIYSTFFDQSQDDSGSVSISFNVDSVSLYIDYNIDSPLLMEEDGLEFNTKYYKNYLELNETNPDRLAIRLLETISAQRKFFSDINISRTTIGESVGSLFIYAFIADANSARYYWGEGASIKNILPYGCEIAPIWASIDGVGNPISIDGNNWDNNTYTKIANLGTDYVISIICLPFSIEAQDTGNNITPAKYKTTPVKDMNGDTISINVINQVDLAETISNRLTGSIDISPILNVFGANRDLDEIENFLDFDYNREPKLYNSQFANFTYGLGDKTYPDLPFHLCADFRKQNIEMNIGAIGFPHIFNLTFIVASGIVAEMAGGPAYMTRVQGTYALISTSDSYNAFLTGHLNSYRNSLSQGKVGIAEASAKVAGIGGITNPVGTGAGVAEAKLKYEAVKAQLKDLKRQPRSINDSYASETYSDLATIFNFSTTALADPNVYPFRKWIFEQISENDMEIVAKHLNRMGYVYDRYDVLTYKNLRNRFIFNYVEIKRISAGFPKKLNIQVQDFFNQLFVVGVRLWSFLYFDGNLTPPIINNYNYENWEYEIMRDYEELENSKGKNELQKIGQGQIKIRKEIIDRIKGERK